MKSLLIVAGAALLAASPQDRKPNIIVIVGDDLGCADLGAYGGKEIPTPNLDSLATNGVRFTNGYVSCPVCSPTRAGLMTGRYQQRFGHEFNPGPVNAAEETFGLPLKETTLPERLKGLGYATGMVGKWHLGYKPEFHPLKRGFDSYFGFLGGAHSYQKPGKDILRGTEPVDEKEYLTDAFAREAAAFIDGAREKPFFLYLTFNAVHLPMEAPEARREKFASIANPKRRTYAAMLTAMDDGVGRVLARLREHKLEEQTLVVFIADNGGPTPANTSRNDPFRGTKGQVYDGGTHVPFLAQWKGKLPAGKSYDAPVIALDLHPTAVAAAGGPPPEKLDGVNLLPYLTGEKSGPPHEALFWRFGAQAAARMGDWKLVLQQGKTELYNLSEDIGEKSDLAAAKPEKLKELQAAYAKWDSELAEPLWGGRGRKKK